MAHRVVWTLKKSEGWAFRTKSQSTLQPWAVRELPSAVPWSHLRGPGTASCRLPLSWPAPAKRTAQALLLSSYNSVLSQPDMNIYGWILNHEETYLQWSLRIVHFKPFLVRRKMCERTVIRSVLSSSTWLPFQATFIFSLFFLFPPLPKRGCWKTAKWLEFEKWLMNEAVSTCVKDL